MARSLVRGNALSKGMAFVITLLMALMFAAGAMVASGQVKNARAGDAVELTYTKWFYPTFPTSVGVVGGDFTGTLAGRVLEKVVIAGGQIVLFKAQYSVTAGANSFTVLGEGQQNNETHTGVFNGEVTAGSLTGAQVHEEYNVVSCAQAPSGLCFQVTARIM
jgi:hypothetical protein